MAKKKAAPRQKTIVAQVRSARSGRPAGTCLISEAINLVRAAVDPLGSAAAAAAAQPFIA